MCMRNDGMIMYTIYSSPNSSNCRGSYGVDSPNSANCRGSYGVESCAHGASAKALTLPASILYCNL